MRTICLLFLCILAFSSPGLAQKPELIINADNLSYDKENHLVEARGSVEVIYENVTVYGENIVYNTKNEEVSAKGGFSILYEGTTIEGDALNYRIQKREGRASDFAFHYQGLELKGEKIDFNEDEYKFKNSSFTTCGLLEPHYHVSAGDIILYPKHGWLVAYWGFFWLGSIPLVPVPTYIYDVSAEQRGARNIPPFPEISANDEDGVYINERLAWHIRRELSGTYSLSYATRKGVGGGLDANYILTETSRGNARIYGNFSDGVNGGITHYLFLGSEIESRPDLPFGFFVQPSLYEYELRSTLSYRERINYQRVSMYPDLHLKRNRGSVFADGLKFDADLGIGMIGEEYNTDLGRGEAGLNLYWEIPELPFGEVTPKAGLESSFYSNGGKWIKTTSGIDYRQNVFGIFALGLGYLHYFSDEGTSPFNFELYRFSSADRLRSDLFFILGETGVRVATSYFLDNWSPEDIDYSLHFKLHCYDMAMQYRSMRNEFTLNFSLGEGQ